jgi:hypothetical protein
MSKLVKSTAAGIGLLFATAAQATSLDSDPNMQLGGLPVTRHQAALMKSATLKVKQDLSTPSAQLAAEPPEAKVDPALFGQFPATVHQAELGLARARSSPRED